MKTGASQLAACQRYYENHREKVKARHLAYRERNRDKLKAYQKAYRASVGITPRSPKALKPVKLYPKPPQLRQLDRVEEPKIIPLSMYVSCSFCESKFRRGTPEYYDGSFERGEFCCGNCGENLELEA